MPDRFAVHLLFASLCLIAAGCGADDSTSDSDAGDASVTDASDAGDAADGATDSSDGGPSDADAAQDTGADVRPLPSEFLIGAGLDLQALRRTGNRLQDVRLADLNYLSVGFATLAEDGTCALSSDRDAEDLATLVAMDPRPALILTVGGSYGSMNFSAVSASADATAQFAETCSALVRDHGLDGMDIDWEWPATGTFPEFVPNDVDWGNFVDLLAAARAELDALGLAERPTLSFVGPADLLVVPPADLTAAAALADYVFPQTFDFSGPWSATTELASQLNRRVEGLGFSVDLIVNAYIEAGVPPEKLVVSFPHYGWGWAGVADVDGGLAQAATGWAPGSGSEEGIYSYTSIAGGFLANAETYWSEEAQVPWLLDAEQGVFVSYDDPRSVAAKAQYVFDGRLAGISGWAIQYDRDGTLIRAALEVLALP